MTHGNVVYQGIRGTAPRVFYWRLVIKPPAISHITKFQSPKGKQVSCKSHCCTLRHFYHLRKEGISSKVQVPRSQLRATLQAGLSMLILSYTTVWEDMVAFRSSRSPASQYLPCPHLPWTHGFLFLATPERPYQYHARGRGREGEEGAARLQGVTAVAQAKGG